METLAQVYTERAYDRRGVVIHTPSMLTTAEIEAEDLFKNAFDTNF